MSLRLFLDADIQHRDLLLELRSAGHDVITANEAGLRTGQDKEILLAATNDGRIVMTFNADDFAKLHEHDPNHQGIIAVYKYTMRRKNLAYDDIIRSLSNLEMSGWDFSGQFVSLNQWRF